MKKSAILLILVLLAVPMLVSAGGLKRVEISPAALVNLGSGHGGQFMGGSVTGDFYFTRSVAFRTTIGFSKDRYYPVDLDYADADYQFWLSMAPYFQLNVGNTWKPYVSLIGSFGVGSRYAQSTLNPAFGMDRSPYQRVQPATTRDAFYSLGGSLGSKFRLTGPVSLFVEVSHFFYNNLSDRGTFYYTGFPYLDQAYNPDKNATYLSFGLSYELDLGKKK
jgi:hypothetical protein